MTHRLTTNYAKNYCNQTHIVKVIVENVVTCFFGTQCIISNYIFLIQVKVHLRSDLQTKLQLMSVMTSQGRIYVQCVTNGLQ